jgi:hypothetical protein
MSFRLSKLQDIAENNGRDYFNGERRMACLYATLYGVNDALAEADDINYILPEVIKASNGILGGLWSSYGSCGIVLAGGMAISMKYGTSDPYEGMTVLETGLKARDFYYWFKDEFESCDCFDLSHVNDWGDTGKREQYNVDRKSFCTDILGRTARKLVDILSVDNPKIVRDV